MPDVTTPVLLLGEGLTLLGAVRCFGQAGIPAYVLTGPDPLARHSRWFRSLPSHTLPRDGYGDLPALLRRLDFEKAVLVPCSDPWAAAVSRLDAELAERFPSVVASAEVIDLFIDKGRFGRLLAEAGIPHPRTFELEGRQSLEHIPDEVFTAGFLKPRNSMAFVESFGTKAFDFQGRDDAEVQLQRAEAAGHAMLLQEYIPGDADQHYFVDGVVDRSGAFPVLFARRRLRIHPPRFGNSTAVRSVPLSEVSEAVDSLHTLAQQVGFRGIFSAEFKHDTRDGHFKLIEINPRPWWYLEFAATCGADVCIPAYRDALGLPVSPNPPYQVDARLIYPFHDWLAWRQAPATRPSLGGLLGFWAGASQARWRRDDPLPAIFALGREGRKFLTRKAKGLLQGGTS